MRDLPNNTSVKLSAFPILLSHPEWVKCKQNGRKEWKKGQVSPEWSFRRWNPYNIQLCKHQTRCVGKIQMPDTSITSPKHNTTLLCYHNHPILLVGCPGSQEAKGKIYTKLKDPQVKTIIWNQQKRTWPLIYFLNFPTRKAKQRQHFWVSFSTLSLNTLHAEVFKKGLSAYQYSCQSELTNNFFLLL